MKRAGTGRTNALLIAVFSALLVAVVVSGSLPDTRDAQPGAAWDGENVRIAEVMTDNESALINRDGLICDYAVLQNDGDAPVDLGGWGLSDRTYEIRYTFAPCTLGAGERLYVFFPGKERNLPEGQERYARFGLSSAGETLLLFSPDGEAADRVDIPALGTNEAYARAQDGAWETAPGQPYDGGTAYAAALFRDVRLSEVISDNASYAVGGVIADVIELHNTSDSAVDLSAYALTDDPAEPEKFVFAAGSVLEAGAYGLVLCAPQGSAGGAAQCNEAFAVSNEGDALFLCSRKTGQIVDMVRIPALEEDCSYARSGDEWIACHSPTPGFANDAQGLAALDAQLCQGNGQGLFISEICASNLEVDLPHVEGHYDFIELYNASDTALDLTGYTLSNDPGKPRRFRLDGLTAPARGTLLIYCEPDNQGMDTDEVTYASFRLSAGGCGVYLYDPSGALLDRVRLSVCYSDTSYGRTPGRAGLYVYDAPTPGALGGEGFAGYSREPVFSLSGGLYEQPVTVSIQAQPGATIHYTLDGSIPTAESTPYTGPVTLGQTAVLRACACEAGLAPSPAATQTYFISTYHTLPVIALTTDPDYLFNEVDGMLADGPLLDRQTQARPWLQAAYAKKRKRPGYIEYYDTDGTQRLSQGLMLQCMGAFSMDMPQKSFSLEANSQFGTDGFAIAAFEDRPFAQYAAFALRNGGQDGLYTRVLDGLQARLVEQAGSSVITQAWDPVIVYINGQYWGHYNLRERVGVEMIAQHEGWLEPAYIDLLEGDGTGSGDVNNGSNAAYRELIAYIEAHPLSDDPQALEHVLSQVDVENAFDYFFFEMFFGNEDSGNIRFYRNAVEGDGKWRYVFYDLDWGLFDSAYGGPEHVLDPEGMGAYHITSNAVLIALLEVPKLRDQFLRRGGELFQTVLTTDNMIALLDEMTGEIQPEMQMHFARWAEEMYPQISFDQPRNPEGAYAYWQERVARAKNVMKKRPTLFWEMVKDQFALTDEQMQAYFGPCPEMPEDAI